MEGKTAAFPIIQGEFDRAKGDVDSKRIFLDQSFRDCVTSDSKLDMEKYSDLVQLSIKGTPSLCCRCKFFLDVNLSYLC